MKYFTDEALHKVCEYLDGHTIFKPEGLIEDGLPKEFVDKWTREHKSDSSSPKSTIYFEGQVVRSLEGVYGLQLLYDIASILQLDYPTAMGRGTQAMLIIKAIRESLANPE